MRSLLYAFCIMILLASCGNDQYQSNLLPDAQGGQSEITFVVDEGLWKNYLKESVESYFRPEISGLFQTEYEFDLMHVTPKGFTNLFQVQRNIILVIVSKKTKKAQVVQKENVYANNQIFFQIEAPTVAEAKALIESRSKDILHVLSERRIEKLQKDLFKNRHKVLIDQMRNNHQFTMQIPVGYEVVKDTIGMFYVTKQGMALCEYGQSSQCYYQNGIWVSYFDYKSESMFQPEFLIQLRDSITKKYIEGGGNGELRAYMETEKEFPVTARSINYNGKFAYEMKGWWNMVNATMGGPFVQYTFVDENAQRVYIVEGFTFASKFKKRTFVHELEAICKSFKIQ